MRLSDFILQTSFEKLMGPASFLMYLSPETLVYIGYAYGVHLDLLFCKKVDFLPSFNLDHGGESGIPTEIQPCLQQMRVFWKA